MKNITQKEFEDCIRRLIKKEISKVKWPTKKDMFKYSLTVILFIVFFALFFSAIDVVVALIRSLGV